MAEVDGKATFRYVSSLRAERNCLECHGQPAGEKDVTGFKKEGMQLGDLAGAVSISLPMEAIEREEEQDFIATVVFFCALMVALTAVLGWGLRRWVTHPVMSENKELRREAESQSNFLTIVTHELKTPLSAILAFSDLLKKPQRDAGQTIEIANEIEGNANELLSMINNVLDTAKFEEGSMALHEDDVDVCDVVAVVRAAAAAVVVPGTPIVRADREMLRRISMNLVGNALQHTESGDSVVLRMSYARGSLVIEVEDTGCGIEAERLPGIFDRFSSGRDAARSGEGGTGLGLFIVRNYAEAVGGSVHVESEIGRGSAFSVLLPLQPVEGEGGL